MLLWLVHTPHVSSKGITSLAVLVRTPVFYFLVPFIVFLLHILQSFMTCHSVCKAQRWLLHPTSLPILKELSKRFGICIHRQRLASLSKGRVILLREDLKSILRNQSSIRPLCSLSPHPPAPLCICLSHNSHALWVHSSSLITRSLLLSTLQLCATASWLTR